MLAVPMTAQVPAVVARLPSTSSIASRRKLAGAIAGPEAAAVGTCAEPLAAPAPGHHRARDDLDCRDVCRDRAHQLRRNRFIAATDEDDGVHRLAPDHLLRVHRHEVAQEQAGRREKNLAERRRRKFQRKAARGDHAALDRRHQFRDQPVAVIELAVRARDTDDRALEQLRRIAHRPRERHAQIAGKSRIPVVRETTGEPGRRIFVHRRL